MDCLTWVVGISTVFSEATDIPLEQLLTAGNLPLVRVVQEDCETV